MQPLCVALVLLFIGVSVAFNPEDPCEQCEYNNGVGYVATEGCRLFYQCTVYPDGSYAHKPLCCGPRTFFNPVIGGCDFGYCDDDYTGCPVDLEGSGSIEEEEGPDDCYYSGADGDVYYKSVITHQSFKCAFGTFWNQDVCGCINNGEHEHCSTDPILNWPFGTNFIDIQCHHVPALPHGEDPIVIENEIDDGTGCVRLNGIDQYLSFDFLNNYFAGRDVDCFAISIWFRQDIAGWEHLNNSPYEGLFGNGNCQSEGGTSSLWFGFQDTFQVGYLGTTDGNAEFTTADADVQDRFAFEPEQWCQFGLSYNDGEVSMYLNGNKTGVRYTDGDFINAKSPWTIGLSIVDCEPYFFTGCVDDLIVFDRCVGDGEMFDLFSISRQGFGQNFPYTRFVFD